MLFTALALATLGLTTTQTGGITLQVSPKGDDASKTGPLKTIQAAIDRAKQSGTPATIKLAAGRYELQEPLKIADFKQPLTIEPAAKAKVTITGTKLLTGWRAGPDGRWRISIPEVKSDQWNFAQLYVNQERRMRPRVVKNDYAYIEKRIDPLPEFAGKGSDGFIFKSGDFDPAWTNQQDIEVLTWLEWSVAHGRIKSIDGSTRTVRFKYPTNINDIWARFKENYRFIVENVKEALSQPGEWYLDRPTGILTYIPMPGEDPKKVTVEAPVAASLVQINNSQSVTIKGIGLEGTSSLTPDGGRFFYQAEADLAGAIQLTNVKDCRIENCDFRRLGQHTVKISTGCNNVAITKNTMVDIGGGGVYVGQMEKAQDPKTVTQNCLVQDNAMFGLGRIHPAAVGVWIGQNPNNTISGNWIEDLYYTGISAGWSWGYQESGSHHNSIVNNTITNVGQRVLSDMGGIYTLSPSPETRIAGNRISNVNSYGYGGWGIYTDEGSTSIKIENNVTYNTNCAGFHQHYGKDNLIKNNVFAFGREFQMQRSRNEDHKSFTAIQNIYLADGFPMFGPENGWKSNGFSLNRNLYWDLKAKPSGFAGQSFDDWQKRGQDGGSVIGDPMFVDPAKGDFRLRPDSPAKKIGFESHPRLAPDTRPAQLPKQVKRTFPLPSKYFPAIWN